jgi:endonuclease/exonuclease/phosphatase (EEP) superfamily protein YafD
MSRLRQYFARRLPILTLLLAALSLTGWLGRWHWGADLAANFVPQYAGAAALLLVGLLWLGRWGWAAGAAVLLCTQLILLLPYYVAPRRDLPPWGEVDQLRVLQLNVDKDHGDPRRVLQFIDAQAARLDVIALLEVTPAWEDTIAELARTFPHSAVELARDNFGMAVLTRLPVDGLELRRLGPGTVPSAWVQGYTGKRRHRFLLVVAHLPPPVGADISALRNGELDAIAAALAANPQRNTVLMGDLNLTPWSYWMRKLRAGTGLRDAQLGLGYAPTWMVWGLPQRLGLPLDHTLVSDRMQVLERTVGPDLGSDHLPIVTTLSMGAAPG